MRGFVKDQTPQLSSPSKSPQQDLIGCFKNQKIQMLINHWYFPSFNKLPFTQYCQFHNPQRPFKSFSKYREGLGNFVNISSLCLPLFLNEWSCCLCFYSFFFFFFSSVLRNSWQKQENAFLSPSLTHLPFLISSFNSFLPCKFVIVYLSRAQVDL